MSVDSVMPADGMSAATEKGTSARPAWQLSARYTLICAYERGEWRRRLSLNLGTPTVVLGDDLPLRFR